MANVNEDKTLPPGMRNPERRHLSNKAIKDSMNVEKYSRETNGEYSRFVGSVAPGGGNPLHYHTSYVETFFPSEGELGLEVDGRTTILQAGETLTIPIGSVHRFFNPSPDVECKLAIEIRPGHEGFEKFLYIAYGMANDGLCDDTGVMHDKLILALISDLGDIRIGGSWTALMNPVLKVIAMYKRWTGTEKELLDRYWYS